MKRLVLLVVLLLFTSPLFADSFQVSAIQAGNVPPIVLDPNGNTLLRESGSDVAGNFLQFYVGVPSFPGTVTLVGNMTLGGQQLATINLAGGCGPPPGLACFTIATWNLPLFNVPVNGVLTLNENGQTETFHFTYFTTTIPPTPEPATLVLLGTGMVGIGWRKYRAIRSLRL